MTFFPRAAVWLRYLSSRPFIISIVRVGEIAGKLAIFVAIVTWLLEIPDRRQQSISSAWTLLNAAQSKPGEGGRGYALEALARVKAPLAFIDLTYAVLQNIKLSNVSMMHATFNKAQLTDVSFACPWWQLGKGCSDLSFSSFIGANLIDVDFSNSDVSSVKFENTVNFIRVDLSNAYMKSTKFYNESIQYVKFSNAFMDDVVFDGFSLGSYSPKQFEGASLQRVVFRGGMVPTSMFDLVKGACDVILPDDSKFNRHCTGREDSSISNVPVQPVAASSQPSVSQ